MLLFVISLAVGSIVGSAAATLIGTPAASANRAAVPANADPETSGLAFVDGSGRINPETIPAYAPVAGPTGCPVLDASGKPIMIPVGLAIKGKIPFDSPEAYPYGYTLLISQSDADSTTTTYDATGGTGVSAAVARPYDVTQYKEASCHSAP